MSEFRSIAIKPRINVKNFGILSVDKRDYRGSSVNYFYMILKLKLFLKLLKAKAAKNNTPLKVMSVMWIKKANFLFKSKVKIIYSALIKKKLNAVKRPTVKSRFTKSTPITKKKSGGYSLAKVLKRGAYLRFRPFPFSRLKEFRRLSRSVIGLDKSRKAVVVKNKIFKVQSNFKNYIKRASSRRKLAAKKLKFISRALIFKALIKSIKKSLFANQLKSISTSDALKTLKSNVLYKLFNSNLLNKKTLGRKKSLFLRKVGYSGVKKSLSLKMALMLFSSNFLSNSNFYN